MSQTGSPIVPNFVAGVARPGSVCEGGVEALQLSLFLENDKVGHCAVSDHIHTYPRKATMLEVDRSLKNRY